MEISDIWDIQPKQSHEVGIPHVHFDELEGEMGDSAQVPEKEESGEQLTIMDSLKNNVDNLQEHLRKMEEIQKQAPTIDDLMRGFFNAPSDAKKIEDEK